MVIKNKLSKYYYECTMKEGEDMKKLQFKLNIQAFADEEEQKQEKEKQLDPVEIIEDLKSKTVSKEDFEKLQEQHNKLLAAFAKGEKLPEKKEESTSIDQLRKELYGDEPHLTNLEFWKKTLELRKAEIDAGRQDPMLPQSSINPLQDSDYENVDAAVNLVQKCIDDCNGDSDVFTAMLKSSLVDPKITPKHKGR